MPAKIKRIFLDEKDYADLKELTPKAKNDSERIRMIIQKIKDLDGKSEVFRDMCKFDMDDIQNAVRSAIEELKR